MGFVDGIKSFFFKPEMFFKKVEKESFRQSMVFIKPMIIVAVLAGLIATIAPLVGLPEAMYFLLFPSILVYFLHAFTVFVLGPEILDMTIGALPL